MRRIATFIFVSANLLLPHIYGAVGFTRLTSETTGVHFANRLTPQQAAENQVRMNGSGVAAGDINGDGLSDLFFASAQGENKLYANRGDFHFEDITAASGLQFPPGHFTSAAFVDLDGDSDLDLLVGSIGAGIFLFENDGHGHFKNISDRSGLVSANGNMSFAIADFDGDGLLDIYVANYRTNTVRSRGLKILNVNGKPMIAPEDRASYELTPDGKLLEYGEPDLLFHNNGSNNFSIVAWTSGLFLNEKGEPLSAPPRDWGLSAIARDLNDDGRPDLYVCNDFFTPDRIWLSDGNGHLRAAPPESFRTTSAFSMGVDVADFNRDSYPDIFVVDMLARAHMQRLVQGTMMTAAEIEANRRALRSQENRNTLFANRGDGSFAEISQFAHLAASDWSWCPVALDVDLDGFEDILITTGHLFDTQNLDIDQAGPATPAAALLKRPPLNMPKRAFRNLKNFSFQECGAEWGFADVGISHGICLVDLDNDGDLDVVVNNLNAEAGIYRNNATAPRIAVRLKGNSPNTRGIGAQIIVRGGAISKQSQAILCGGRYLSSDDPMRSFAAGSLTNKITVEVIWPGGRISTVESVKPNSIAQISEDAAQVAPHEPEKKISPLFEDATRFIQSRHNDQDFDDFSRQASLPRRFGDAGPGISWGDLNGDGKEDLIVSAAKGEELEILFNQGAGRFSRFRTGQYIGKTADDQTTILVRPTGPNEGMLFVGEASYETGQTNSLNVYSVSKGIPSLRSTLSLDESSAGTLAMADVNGDGELDLFVGGRVNPGKYPQSPTSRLYLKTTNGYTLHQEFSGLISAAVFSDLDLDGTPELILAGEWSPLRVLKLRGQHFEEIHCGLEKYVGWWNGVTTADLDGDGKLDIIASNWGRNTKYEEHDSNIRAHYGPWGARGQIEMIATYRDDTLKKEVPLNSLDLVRRSAPALAEKFPTYAAFARAGIEEILSGTKSQSVEVNTFDTMVFLNRGDHFVPILLPTETQWAPAFGIAVGDINGDGIEDIFFSQNFSPFDQDTSRAVEGRGLILQGLGNGDFRALSAQESGIAMYGDGRGSAFCDYDHDGRLDLAVGQNRGPVRLFHNVKAPPGLRVRLKGSPGNPTAVGAILRMKTEEKWGPVHEIKMGEGYWSQQSAVTLFPRGGSHIQVRWPNNDKTTTPIPSNATELTIDIDQAPEKQTN